ncbi:GNAT family N-acetyltransferase [Marinitoga litoralis]|uniref:GNAT family N-acetyltransferase n=1 Tax=Marinitoga litoralis TaxID=570855 RepID=UPI00195FD3DD|nr:GNAT family N-acetyltransferase [Marinitoga litoralis]MBM7558403.1 ribosomal protein S18 acetylase RimI-like enzyme [Marinitoga litoralis]
MEFKVLEEKDIDINILDNFNRFQETKFMYKDNEIIENHFIDDWTLQDKRNRALSLINTVKDGGIVVGVFENNNLIGFGKIPNKFLGEKNEYLELDSFHVSKEYRNKGIGKKLFLMLAKLAKEKGAKKLYIGAHPSIETQAFYRKMGCVPAKEIIREIYDREPLDIQLEFDLSNLI